MFYLLSFIFKDKEKAGLITSLSVFLFFSYGHFVNLLEGFCLVIWRFTFGPNRFLLLLSGLIFVLGVYFVVRARRGLRNLTNFLNVVAVSLVVISLIKIGGYELKTMITWHDRTTAEDAGTGLMDLKKPAMLPNIYYIILDGYAGAEILRDMYSYDNTEFMEFLRQKGFYVADKSRSNYVQSELSLASSLNFEYLNDLANRVGVESDNRKPLINMIKNNRVVHFLKQYGYVFVAFSSGYSGTEIRNADIYLTKGWILNEFQNELVNTTPIPVLLDKLRINSIQHDLHRKKILYGLDHLADTCKLETPIFVFIHIIAPHPPFVFGEHGEAINRDIRFSLTDFPCRKGKNVDERINNYRKEYKEQLIFINSKLEKMIDDIISYSHLPPVIILQADHGPNSMMIFNRKETRDRAFKERTSILN
ncbi:hypothetical protein HQ584_07975, partial [Patescibacteria group bacterium]|nr:hypothetical protein [Patescibacteria group bacterium]